MSSTLTQTTPCYAIIPLSDNREYYSFEGIVNPISRNDVPLYAERFDSVRFTEGASYFLSNQASKMATRTGIPRLRTKKAIEIGTPCCYDKDYPWPGDCFCRRFPPYQCKSELLYDGAVSDTILMDSVTTTRTLRRASQAAKEYVLASRPAGTGAPTASITSWRDGYLGSISEEHLPWMVGPDGRRWLDHAALITPRKEVCHARAAHLSWYTFSNPEEFFHPLFLKDQKKEEKFEDLTYDQILEKSRKRQYSDQWALDHLAKHNRRMQSDINRLVSAGRRWAKKLKPNAQALIPTSVNVNHHIEVPGLKELAEMLSKANPAMNWPVFLRELGFAGLHVYQAGFSVASIATSLTQLMCNTPTELRNKIASAVLSIFSRKKPNHQSAGPAYLGTAVAAGVVLITAMATSVLPSTRSIDLFLSRFGQIGRNISTIEKLTQVTEKWTETIVKFIGVHFLGHDAASYDCWKTINDWTSEVDALMTTDFESKSRSDPTIIAKVNSLLQRGSQIGKELDAARVPFSQRASVTQATQFLMQARRIASSSGAGQVAPRTAPVVVHIFGDSGVGKSTMLGYLSTKILISQGSRDPQDLHDKVYYRRPIDENWDGYRNGTEIVICDDFGALKDTSARPNPQVQEQIHMSNTAHFPLPMAHLEDKGTTIFEAKAIIWTTNRAHFSFDSMSNPEAVYNRVALKFHQRVKPEFEKIVNVDNQNIKTLDQDKLAKALLTDPDADRKCMLFDLVHPTCREVKVLAEGLSFEQMSDMVVHHVEVKQHRGKKFLAEQKNYFTEQLKKIDNTQAAGFVEKSWYDTIRHPAGGWMQHVDIYRAARENLPMPFEMGTPLPQRGMVAQCCLLRACDADRAAAEFAFALTQENGIAHWMVKWNVEECWEHIKTADEIEDDIEKLTHKLKRYSASIADKVSNFVWAHHKVIAVALGGFVAAAWMYFMHKHVDVPKWEKADKAFRERAKQGEFSDQFLDLIEYKGPRSNDEGYGRSQRAQPRGNQEGARWDEDREDGDFHSDECKTKYLDWLSAADQADDNVQNHKDIAIRSIPALFEEEMQILGKPAEWHCECRSNFYVRTNWKRLRNNEAYGRQHQRQSTRNAEAWGEGLPVAKKSGEPNQQGLSDEAAGDIRRSLYKNLWSIASYIDGKWWFHGTIFFVCGRVAITNKHILAMAGEKIRIYSRFGNRTLEFKKEEISYRGYEETSKYGYKDVVVMEFPRSVPLHGDARKYFMNRKDFSHHDFLERANLLGYTPQGAQKIQTTMDIRAVDSANFQLVDSLHQVSYIREVYEYAIDTEKGDCGAVLVSFDKRFPRKVCGIHMAAGDAWTKWTGVAVALHREALDELIEQLPLRWAESMGNAEVPLRCPINPEVVVNANGSFLELPPSPVGLGQLGSTLKEFENKKTSIRPTPVAHLLPEPLTYPAHLKMVNGVDPAINAMKKAATPLVHCDQELVDQAASAVRQMWSTNVLPRDRQVLTDEEAIMGVQGDPVYAPINRQAGAGYGWPKKGKGKTHWLGSDEYILDDPELRARLDSMLVKLRAGERCEVVWNDTLKDELRSKAKLEAIKTRLFSAGEMGFTILLRKYFMGFCAHRMRHPVDNESCVGMNPLGFDWTKLARKLRSKGKAIVAGDFSNYDGTLLLQLLWAVFDNIVAHYPDATPEERLIRILLWMEIVQSIHNFRGTLYEWTHSQPSGCALTTVLNTEFHQIAVRYAWLYLALLYAMHLADMESFAKYVYLACYGDDDVLNISDYVIDWFNQQTLTEAYATLGMTYTDETKKTSDRPFSSLEEVRFLKRAFVWDHDLAKYRSPLDIKGIIEIPKWMGKGDTWTLTKLELEAAVGEAAQLSRTEYEEVLAVFEPARQLTAQHVPIVFEPYHVARRIAATRTFPWVLNSGSSDE